MNIFDRYWIKGVTLALFVSCGLNTLYSKDVVNAPHKADQKNQKSTNAKCFDDSGACCSVASACSAEYAYIYNITGQAPIALETAILFDSNGVLTPGILHTPGSSAITFVKAGNYLINFSVSVAQPNQFALFLNNVAVANSIYGAGAGTEQNDGQVILTIAAGDVLTLRNHTSLAPVILQTLAGGTKVNVNASITILKL